MTSGMGGAVRSIRPDPDKMTKWYLTRPFSTLSLRRGIFSHRFPRSVARALTQRVNIKVSYDANGVTERFSQLR
jgi:hypothetical protein